MARTGQEKKSLDPKIEKAREDALKEFYGLHKKAVEHIKESLDAVQPCVYCDKQGQANKQDAEGKCLKCHGSKLTPDVARRDWASEQVTERTSPKPKAVEMSVDQTTYTASLEAEAASLKDEELNQAKALLDKLIPGGE